MVRSLPLFHRIAGQPVIVLGEGDAAAAKARLVERAGGTVVAEIQRGIDEGARLAFIAHDDEARCEADALRLRGAGLLVNVVDKPDWCDFTTPSLLERDPVLIAVGTSGASAGLAKHLRLRLEALLPPSLGKLAQGLAEARGALRKTFPESAERRRALDAALGEGGALDPLDAGSADRLGTWLEAGGKAAAPAVHEIVVTRDDADDLTLRQARLLGMADAVLADPQVSETVLLRARADAVRLALPYEGDMPAGLVVIVRRG
ncbi:siroheme synthase [Aurantiacibacter xanthus]|uniref:precorrin-2 dehydrogenase n=1 Tax=Aurantiacibacter xanthus TaxID=1784712 RepID=A0A3A1P5L5_9SPHN|nr:bifunctional precorrin-2 dehydrogenase/sirohydrochlorin ferrochelatase [Aurantiacibacter xanthus]RIV85262.1 siroheme synthase [Aurantiacibacter xanthus]